MSFSITPLGENAPIIPEAPTIYSKSYRHSIVDSTYQPERSMLSMVKGRPRLGQYFSCWLGESEEPKPFAMDGLGTYQSYYCIDNVPLKIDGQGSFSFNAQMAESEEVYSAWVIFDVVPCLHDVIIMDVGDGNAGLFAITEQPEIRNVTANKVYQIQIKFLSILTEEMFNILSSRVVKNGVYSKDSALHGGHSVITHGEEKIGQELFNWLNTIGSYIMREFYWNPECTIVFERNGQKVYDPYLVNFLCAVIPPNARTLYPQINQFSIQYAGLERGRYGVNNVWEFLLRGDMNILKICDNTAAIVETTRLQPTRLYGNLRSSKIRYFITTDPKDLLVYNTVYNQDGYPILQPSSEENITYLFSAEFYKGAPQGEFENLVYSSYRDQQIDHQRLLDYCNGYFELELREQLYHGAILLRLLQLSRAIGGPL